MLAKRPFTYNFLSPIYIFFFGGKFFHREIVVVHSLKLVGIHDLICSLFMI